MVTKYEDRYTNTWYPGITKEDQRMVTKYEDRIWTCDTQV
jgi:hypothetical protein